jgi:hypothetical protein
VAGRITKQGDGTVRTLRYQAADVLLSTISRTSASRERGSAIARPRTPHGKAHVRDPQPGTANRADPAENPSPSGGGPDKINLDRPG